MTNQKNHTAKEVQAMIKLIRKCRWCDYAMALTRLERA